MEDYVLTTLKKNRDKLNDFLKELIMNSKRERRRSEKIRTYVLEGSYWEEFKRYVPMSLEDVFLKQEQKDFIINDIEEWMAEKEFYLKRNWTFKRGYLLYGPAGNGKSSLIAAIARKYKRDIYFLNLNSIRDDEDLLKGFRRIPAGCMLVVEDIDQVWEGRETVSENCKVTFSTFINLLSGVLDKEDIILFFTTNFIDKLDKALIRDGRIDVRIFIDNPEIEVAQAYLASLYEIAFKLSYYKKGRSIAKLANLFKEHRKTPAKAKEILENEAIGDEEFQNNIKKLK
jgi:chaperone BCS1